MPDVENVNKEKDLIDVGEKEGAEIDLGKKEGGKIEDEKSTQDNNPVSYTHLTLPTILLV